MVPGLLHFVGRMGQKFSEPLDNGNGMWLDNDMTTTPVLPQLGEHIAIATLLGSEEAVVRSTGKYSDAITVEFVADRVRMTARWIGGQWTAC